MMAETNPGNFLNTREADAVHKRLFAPFADNTPKYTDGALLFGGRSTSGTVARHAAAHFHAGAFPKIMVLGGARIFQPSVAFALERDHRLNEVAGHLRDIFTPRTEAAYMRKVLIEQGVPEDKIILGDVSAKKADKVVKAAKEEIMDQFASASVYTYAPYLRRTIGTMRFQNIDIPLDGRLVCPFGVNLMNWNQSLLASLVKDEHDNMSPNNPDGYVGKFTTAVDIEEENALRATLPDRPRDAFDNPCGLDWV